MIPAFRNAVLSLPTPAGCPPAAGTPTAQLAGHEAARSLLYQLQHMFGYLQARPAPACSPMPSRLQPYAPKLQPRAPRLQPRALRLQPRAPRPQPHVVAAEAPCTHAPSLQPGAAAGE